MDATSQTKEKVSLKLLVDKETNKVLFAEAGKDFVDVLYSFFTLPLGTIARLVQKDSKIGPVTIGCLNKLYQSVANLDKEWLSTEESKGLLLQPKNSSEHYCNTIKLNIDDTQPAEYFVCANFETCSYGYFTTSINEVCGCGDSMNRSISLVSSYKGFVKDDATFVITDNLNVIPTASHYTSLALVQNSGIKSMSSLKEMTINVTKEKVLDLLKYSLLSKTPLTDIFLAKMKPSLERSILFLPSVYEYSSSIKITLNLVIRKSDKKILYAQGDQDFVDILLSFLTFPLGAISRLLEENSSLGSIDTLYNSIVNLDENKYLLSKEAKNRLVSPYGFLQSRSMQLAISCPENTCLYYFNYYQVRCKQSINNDQFIIRDEVRDNKNVSGVKLVYIESDIASFKGFVKGPAMYLVADDLILAPSSPISAFHIINRFETPLNDVKEKVVTVGIEEYLNILKASLISTSALTFGLSHLLTDVKEEK